MSNEIPNEDEFGRIVKICLEEAPDIIEKRKEEGEPFVWGENEHSLELGAMLFDRVLPIIDEHHEDLSRFEAAPISDICYEVASDIVHSDILGDLLDDEEDEPHEPVEYDFRDENAV